MEKCLQKLQRKKQYKGLDLKLVQSEIDKLFDNIFSNPEDVAKYNRHMVTLDGQKYIVFDAIAMNRQMNQTKHRGDYRYLFDKDKNFIGICQHDKKGGYQNVR